jgi:F-type H+-transporting ATPase subunit alpha
MTELLKQGQYAPLPVEKQVLILFAGANGFVDALPLSALDRYERELYAFVEAKHPELLSGLGSRGTDSKAFDGLATQMRSVLAEFAKEFAATLQAAT